MKSRSLGTPDLPLFDREDEPPAGTARLFESHTESASTFKDNLSLPIHRWFRYSAGFSASWVRDSLEAAKTSRNGDVRVLDPFAGSGTVLLEAELAGVPSFGIESHPFVARVARTKLRTDAEPRDLRRYASELMKRGERTEAKTSDYSELIKKCYPEPILVELDVLRRAWRNWDHPLADFGWLALAAILRQCSPVGTANWQYVLPNKTKARVIAPFAAFKAKTDQIAADLDRSARPSTATLIEADAREMTSIPAEWANLVITSPPYPNNFDYADATRLEMSFFGDVSGWGDLQAAVRSHLLRSCTQHISALAPHTESLIADRGLDPIRPALATVCERLEKERHAHGGKKNYHTMVAAYFVDMARVWNRLRQVTARGADICFVIGDSAPYGIHVPVDQWMGDLAIAAGFKGFRFEKTRDRNLKWKNRKHSVPLLEGQLLVEG